MKTLFVTQTHSSIASSVHIQHFSNALYCTGRGYTFQLTNDLYQAFLQQLRHGKLNWMAYLLPDALAKICKEINCD